MKNASPIPVTCALCKTREVAAFDMTRCWVQHGGSLYAVCTQCIEEREVSFDTGVDFRETTPGYGTAILGATIVSGKATLGDLEQQLREIREQITREAQRTDSELRQLRERYGPMYDQWLTTKGAYRR